MIYIGNHLSVSKGYLAMGKQETKLGGNTFAFFTRNPRGGKAKQIDEKDLDDFHAYLAENQFGTLVAHAPYTMNLCSAKEDVRSFSLEMLADDMERMQRIQHSYYNFHPGSHVGQGTEKGIALIADALNQVLKPGHTTTILLETMAGKGSEIGGRFEELRAILDQINLSDQVGVCFDTCHVWDGGYDIVENLDGVLEEFDRIIGLDKLYAVHLNDSMNPRGSHKDRHQKIGEGEIGAEALKRVVNHPALQDKPFILETPNDDTGYAKEIALVQEWNLGR